MTRQQAIALIQYISRAHGMIPTTGAEWEIIREGLAMLESVANDRGVMVHTPHGESKKADLKSV
jgi:predicted metal-dependent TIM-barrel fold hydrolase